MPSMCSTFRIFKTFVPYAEKEITAATLLPFFWILWLTDAENPEFKGNTMRSWVFKTHAVTPLSANYSLPGSVACTVTGKTADIDTPHSRASFKRSELNNLFTLSSHRHKWLSGRKMCVRKKDTSSIGTTNALTGLLSEIHSSLLGRLNRNDLRLHSVHQEPLHTDKSYTFQFSSICLYSAKSQQ